MDDVTAYLEHVCPGTAPTSTLRATEASGTIRFDDYLLTGQHQIYGSVVDSDFTEISAAPTYRA